MDEHEKERPKKAVFEMKIQERILKKAKTFILNDLLPDEKIKMIIIFGSLAKNTFGKYERRWKHGIYSDIDVLILVKNGFNPPKEWKIWYEHEKFCVYTHGRLEKKYLIQYMLWKEHEYSIENNKCYAETWGIPLLLEKSQNPHIVIYSNNK